jgi:hypothetical protein
MCTSTIWRRRCARKAGPAPTPYASGCARPAPVSHGRLAPVAARCAAILDSPTRAASEDGRELRLALDDVLDLVVRANGTVTSPPVSRSTSQGSVLR